MKRAKTFNVVFIMMCLFIWGEIANAATYISCGTQKGIPAGLPGFTRAIIMFIQIIAPILLILMGSIDFLKVVFSEKPDDLDKAIKKFVKRAIGAVSIFFVVLLVQLFLKMITVNKSNTMECLACFTVDSSKCHNYEEKKVDDNQSEMEKAREEREKLEKEREKKRKENEKKSNEIKEKAE